MVPPGQANLNPAANTIQSLVAVKRGEWRIALYQNTPAQFHGRPDLASAITEELRELLPGVSGDRTAGVSGLPSR